MRARQAAGTHAGEAMKETGRRPGTTPPPRLERCMAPNIEKSFKLPGAGAAWMTQPVKMDGKQMSNRSAAGCEE